MGEKQTQQHRQHFNLSESAKQMLEELTAKRYPGKQRRQSQLVEDLITEAFTKERSMNTVTTGMQDPEPNGLEPATTEAISMAHNEAARMGAIEVYPEHLLLGVIGQGESKAAKLLCMYGMDMQAIRVRATEVFSSHYRDSANAPLVLSEESQECVERAISLAVDLRFPSVSPEHLVVSVLRYPPMQPFLIPFLPSVSTLMARLGEGMGPAYAAYLHQWEGNERREWGQRDHEKFLDEMERLLQEEPTNLSTIRQGDVVEGVIVQIDQDEILVDVGLESMGVLSTKELPASGYGSFNELHINDRVLVYVIQPATQDGRALLSLKRALAERQWRIAEEQYKNGELLKARVIDYNKGGLIVDVAGIRGFVPISQILNLKREEVASGGENQETAAKLQSMKDKELQLKIIEINRARNRLILSERLAVPEWRQRRREELLDELKPGEIRHGIVSNIANFGVFVDLGGAEGLVHIDQVAWSRVNHPSEVLHVGQHVEVQVLSVDKEKKKIALSIKRAEVDPWTTVEQRYTPGQVVTGVITKIAPFGVFARIEDGVEGIIHLSELPPGMDPGQNLHEGQRVQLRILRFDAERRRLGLSLRQVDEVDLKETLVEGITICSSCKREVQSKWKHCVYCGASLARVCPQCGSRQPEIEGARFCFECGGKLE